MTTPLDPQNMQSLLTHDHRYQRALAVLTDNWQAAMAEESLPYRQQIDVDDLKFARALVMSATVTSEFDFESYAGVQQMRQHFGNQLNLTAQQWLVRKYV